MSLSVRENAALAALPRFARFGVVRRRVEMQRVEEQRARWHPDPIDRRQRRQPSGGNQQKVMLARALLAQCVGGSGRGADGRRRCRRPRRNLSHPARRRRPTARRCVIVSSDTLELEGLCDRVMVFSRGHVVGELDRRRRDRGEDRPHDGHRHAHRRGQAAAGRPDRGAKLSCGQRLRQFVAGDYAPSVVLAILILVLGAYRDQRTTCASSRRSISKKSCCSRRRCRSSASARCAPFSPAASTYRSGRSSA